MFCFGRAALICGSLLITSLHFLCEGLDVIKGESQPSQCSIHHFVIELYCWRLNEIEYVCLFASYELMGRVFNLPTPLLYATSPNIFGWNQLMEISIIKWRMCCCVFLNKLCTQKQSQLFQMCQSLWADMRAGARTAPAKWQ